jgi:hypothetical protein
MDVLLGHLRSRSRDAQRVLLEVELLRALERAYASEQRSRELAARAEWHRVVPDATPCADAALQQSIETLRRKIAVVVERCRRLERVCGLALDVRAECAPASAHQTAADPDPEEAAVTKRSPEPERGQ